MVADLRHGVAVAIRHMSNRGDTDGIERDDHLC